MRTGRLLPAAAVPAWVGLVVAGLVRLIAYDTTPSDAGAPAVERPAAFPDIADTGTPVLFMAVHPRCPCALAGISELARLMARCQGRLNAHLLFLSPGGLPDAWTRTALWRQAEAIPGVTVHADEDGRASRRLGLVTSGHVVVYDRDGRLAFTGGITPSRGHEGDNGGADAIAALVSGPPPAAGATAATAPVFGCSLFAVKVP